MPIVQPSSRALRNFVASFMFLALVVTLTVVIGGASAAPSLALSGKSVAPAPAAGKPQVDSGCWSDYAVPDLGTQSVLYDVAAVSQDDAWTVGFQNTTTETLPLAEHWDGSHWSIVATPLSDSPRQTLNAIESVSADSIWAGGGELQEQSFRSVMLHWNGISWSRVSTPNIGTIGNISAASADDVWAVTVDGSPSTIHWNGMQWSRVALPSGYDELREVEAVSANDVWAVGSWSTQSFLHWDGTQWNPVPYPLSTGLAIAGIQALSPTDIWAVGSNNIPSSGIYDNVALHWNGISWSIVQTPNIPNARNELSDLAAVSPDDVWAVGNTWGTTTPIPLAMHWDGTAWTFASLPTAANNSLSGVAASSGNDVWAVGGIVMRYTNPCSPPSPTPTATSTSTPTVTPTATATYPPQPLPYCWTSVPAPDTGHGWTHGTIQAVSTLSANDVWVLATYQDAQSVSHTVAARWNGIHWSVVSALPSSAFDMLAISDNDIWAVGLGGDGEHWDGSHWTVVTISNPSIPINALYALDGSSSNNVWAVGLGPGNEDETSGVIMHWDGTRWSGILTQCVEYRSVKVISPSSVWVGGNSACGTESQELLYWNGTSFVDGGLPPSVGSIEAIGLTSLTDVWVSVRGGPGVPSHFLHSDGSHWSSVPSQGLSASHIEPISPDDVWATTSDAQFLYNSGTLLHWNGHAWDGIDFPGDNIADLGAISSNNIWAVGSTMLPNDSRMLTLHYNTACIPTPAPTATATPTLVPPPCPGEHFTDVCPNEYFYPYVQALTNDGILYGYASAPPCRNSLWIPCFNPNNPSTRGQISKIVSLAANFNDPVSGQTFEDVAPGSRFYTYTERMAERGIIAGYPCGGPNEPCIPPLNRPYFRTNNNVSRGQLSKMVALAFQWNDPPTGQTFEDVPPGAAFYTYTVELSSRGIINGYPCGGPSEPCNPPANRSYFRPSYNVLRGQTAKIVQLARTQPTLTPTPTLTPASTSTLTPTATTTATVTTVATIPATSVPTSTQPVTTDTPAPTITSTTIAKDPATSTTR